MDSHHQQRRREELYSLMGDLPPRSRPVSSRLLSQEQTDWGHIQRLELDLNDQEPVPALFIKPLSPPPLNGRFPVILYNHSHGGRYHVGKDELLAGSPYILRPWGEELARAGVASLSIDHWAFGQRNHHSESDTFKRMLWYGQVMWGAMVYDSLKAVDYLATRPDIDPARLGTLGMSMGSTMAWWLAALDPRMKLCIDLCCLTDFQSLLDTENLKGHGLYYFVPSLLKHFTTSQINELIAPRPHLALAGELDALTPMDGLRRVDEELKRAYVAMGAAEKWKLATWPVAHQETAGMREEAMKWVREKL